MFEHPSLPTALIFCWFISILPLNTSVLPPNSRSAFPLLSGAWEWGYDPQYVLMIVPQSPHSYPITYLLSTSKSTMSQISRKLSTSVRRSLPRWATATCRPAAMRHRPSVPCIPSWAAASLLRLVQVMRQLVSQCGGGGGGPKGMWICWLINSTRTTSSKYPSTNSSWRYTST